MRTDSNSRTRSTERPGVRAAVDVARGLAAGGVLLSAAVHLDLWDVQRFREIETIGPLFLLNVIGGGVLGLLVLAWRHWLPALAAAGYGAATVIAFWISVVHGLFGLKEVATGSAQILAEVAEYIAIGFGLAAAAVLWRTRHSIQVQPRPSATGGRGWAHRHRGVTPRLGSGPR
jgi:hypothetical protein